MSFVERARAAAEAQLVAATALPIACLHTFFGGTSATRWPKRSFGDVCNIQLGKMLSPMSRIGARPRPYLRNANVLWNRFDLSDTATMDFAEDEEEKFRLKPGDVLVCEGGEPGRAAVWNGQITPCFYQKALHRVRVGPGIEPHFVMYRLWFGSVTGEFSEAHAKSTIAHLPAVRLAKLEARFPDVAEQQRIVAQLSEKMTASQRMQEQVERQVEGLDALPAALLRQAFSGEL